MGTHAAFARLSGSRRPLRLMLFLGTRPEVVKLGPVIVAARARPEVEIRLVGSAQHPPAMLEAFTAFGIEPDRLGEGFRAGETLIGSFRTAMLRAAQAIESWRPDVFVVQGDTTSALGGAVAAFYDHIPVAHVEAGLRTNDLEHPYPEEMNRRAMDSFATFLFPPTPLAAANLAAEAARDAHTFVTGNTVVDAVLSIAHDDVPLALAPPLDAALDERYLRRVLVTVHRRESWGRDMDSIAAGLCTAARRAPDTVFLLPLHPNPIVRRSFDRPLPANLVIGEPLPYVPFVKLLARSDLVVTDSGGVLEEATALGVPALILRRTTERPEAVTAGAAQIVGVGARAIQEAIARSLNHPSDARAQYVYGDGKAAERIVDYLLWSFDLRAASPEPFVPDTVRGRTAARR